MRTGRGGMMGALCTLLLATGACQDQVHVGEEGFYAFAMTDGTAALAEDGEGGALFVVEERIELPIREPTREQRRLLRREARDRDIPFDRMPWVERGDYEIEVDWVLSNLTDDPVTVDLVINGFNEFHEYVPLVAVVDDEILVGFSQWERKLRLEPLERRAGTTREEAFDEAAVDLAAVGNGAPNPDQIVHPDNQSDRDERAQPFIPEVIPALTGFRLGLRRDATAPLVVEATVRVRDTSGRIVSRAHGWTLPAPTPVPAAALPET